MYTIADLPAAGLRSEISASIDRVLSDCAGTIAGADFRGVFRAGWDPRDDMGLSVGSTRLTLSVDAALVPSHWAGLQSPATPTPWHAHAQPLRWGTEAGDVIADDSGVELLTDPETSRRVGALVVITLGEGCGSYRIVEVLHAAGGRSLLVLEAAA